MSYFNCEACKWRVAGPPGKGSHEVYVSERRQRDGSVRYAVERDGWVANARRQWEYEPLPSSREDDFIERTRFATWEDAAAVAQHMAANPYLWTDGRYPS